MQKHEVTLIYFSLSSEDGVLPGNTVVGLSPRGGGGGCITRVKALLDKSQCQLGVMRTHAACRQSGTQCRSRWPRSERLTDFEGRRLTLPRGRSPVYKTGWPTLIPGDRRCTSPSKSGSQPRRKEDGFAAPFRTHTLLNRTQERAPQGRSALIGLAVVPAPRC